MYAFQYGRPGSLADATSAGKADEARYLAGGQTLLPTLKARLAQPSHLVDIGGLAGLDRIAVSGAMLSIGAGAGETRGGAMISPLHANFIVNLGRARAADIEALADALVHRTLTTGSGR